MLLALQHLEVYVGSSTAPVGFYTAHNPLGVPKQNVQSYSEADALGIART